MKEWIFVSLRFLPNLEESGVCCPLLWPEQCQSTHTECTGARWETPPSVTSPPAGGAHRDVEEYTEPSLGPECRRRLGPWDGRLATQTQQRMR